MTTSKPPAALPANDNSGDDTSTARNSPGFGAALTIEALAGTFGVDSDTLLRRLATILNRRRNHEPGPG